MVNAKDGYRQLFRRGKIASARVKNTSPLVREVQAVERSKKRFEPFELLERFEPFLSSLLFRGPDVAQVHARHGV